LKYLRLPVNLREKLKKPQGILLKGSPNENIPKVKYIVQQVNPRKIISVGDVVSHNLISNGIIPDLCIIDRKTLREKYETKILAELQLNIKNPAGLINLKSFDIIEDALKSNKKTLLLVDGEEDLLTIPAVILAPKNSIILYGQPNEGMVVIKVKNSKKKKFLKMMKLMEETQNAIRN